MAETKYETVVLPNLKLIERWKRNGASEEEIAKRLGIAYSTFNLYKSQKSELSEVLKKGKEIVDSEVENALLQNALKGNITAQIFWLKNRCPVEWKDKHEVETSVTNENKELMREYLNSVKKE